MPNLLTYMNLPVQESNVGGDCPCPPHHTLHCQSRLQVLGVWHAVGEDGGLQSNYRITTLQGPTHLWVH